MESKAKLAGHPIHPMLVVFPLGLFATSLIFDLIRLFSTNGIWSVVSEYMIGAGIIGGLIAAVFGTIDWMAIPQNTRAKSIGWWHGEEMSWSQGYLWPVGCCGDRLRRIRLRRR